MLRYKRNIVLDICDYDKNIVCPLYDSTSDIQGQAANVVKMTERNGWKQLSFTIPSACLDENGQWVDNYRLEFLKADYRIRVKEWSGDDDDEPTIDWFLLQEPKISHKNFSKDVSVQADHGARLLKTKNLGLEFSDKEGNNVGTAAQLLSTILEGTGWEPGIVHSFTEKYDPEKEKVRSLKAAAKTGAFKLIASMCDLFEAKPVYRYEYDENGVEHAKVDIVPMNPFSMPKDGGLPEVGTKAIELFYGKNLKNISRTLDTENLITKLFCYGSYGDKTSGYCGIDEWHHDEYKYTQTISNNTEYQIDITDDNDINYIRYFTAPNNVTNAKLVWSLLDPASMSYIWCENDGEGKAYSVYETAKSNSQTPLNNPTKDTVTNYVSYLMDFDYYNSVGLLTDEMLQQIAKYQREMPGLLEAANEKATAFNEAADKLSSTVGYVNFVKLNVDSYSLGENGLTLTLDQQTPVIYRTDYDKKEADRFKWRAASRLKPNGDAFEDYASIVYIIKQNTSNGNTVYTYDAAYLRAVNGNAAGQITDDNLKNPTNITLWFDGPFDTLGTYDVYLFAQNSINGSLGASQAQDEAAVQAIDNTTEQVDVKHPVYFVKLGDINEPLISDINGYAWMWKYDMYGQQDSEMWFCYKDRGDIGWHIVHVEKEPPNQEDPPQQLQDGDYYFCWGNSKVYVYEGSEWRELDNPSTVDKKEERTVTTFGSVWKLCRSRDMYWQGFSEYYTIPIDKTYEVGNYAIKDKYDNYQAFSLTQQYGQQDSKKFVYDSINRWVYVAGINDDPTTADLEDIITRTMKTHTYPIDAVFDSGDDILESATWSEGDLSQQGNLKHESSYVRYGGGEIDGSSRKRTGFLGVYPKVTYALTGVQGNPNIRVCCYTMAHSFLGDADLSNNTFRTLSHTRFVRFVADSTADTSSWTCRSANSGDSFVVDEEEYVIIGEGTGVGKKKGILPLIADFLEYSHDTYDPTEGALGELQAEQNKIKALDNLTASTLGDLYREGYWQKADYVDGDEDKLYFDGLENLEKISKPEAKYDIQYLDLYDANTHDMNYAVDETAAVTYWPDIEADWGVHINDPGIAVNQWGFIDKLSKCYDQPWKTTISVNTDMSTIGQHSFTDVMTHIADVAKQVNAKMEMYDRSESFLRDGSIATSNLEGIIDANRTSIVGGSSTWYTDERGNMVFIAADGQQAMMITGTGFAIANRKDEWGEWVWRTFGDGNGFTADLITAGTLQAARVITNELMQYLGESLVLSSNESIIFVVEKKITDSEASTNDQINALDRKYEASVKNLGDELLQEVKQREGDVESLSTSISQTDRQITTQIKGLKDEIKTTMELDENGLHLRNPNASYEALLTSNSLDFVNSNDPSLKVASFGAERAWVDKLRSNKELQVGTEDDGWFDFVVMDSGMGEKWRTAEGKQPPVSIQKQPNNATGSNTVSFEVQANGDASYVWQKQPNGKDNTWSSTNIENSVISLSLSQTDSVLYMYRCKVNDLYSDAVEAFCSSVSPVVISENNGTLTSITVSQVQSYQWYTLNNSNIWQSVSGATSAQYTPNQTGYYRCVVSDGQCYNATEIIYVER